MTKSDQLSLFAGMTKVAPVRVRPWRKTLADDAWGLEKIDPEKATSCFLDLLRRNRELLKALKLAGVSDDATDVVRFREEEKPMIESYALVRAGDVEDAKLPEVARRALELAAELGKLRRRILDGIDDEQHDRVLKAESRVRIKDFEIIKEIAEAELAIAEESGRVFEIEIPLSAAGTPDLGGMGILGLSDVEALTAMSMQAWKADQENLNLPRQARLRTLLKGLPAVWLDATWVALELGKPFPRKRREREEKIARTLLDSPSLRRVMSERLTPEERQLLSLLLEKGGQSPTAPITRRFGSEAGDGWFWNETPPISTMGRVRLFGLAFVGRAVVDGRRFRSMVVPKELRQPIREVMEQIASTESERPA